MKDVTTLEPTDDELMEKIQALPPQLVSALATLLKPSCPDNPELVRLYDTWLGQQMEFDEIEDDAAREAAVGEIYRVEDEALAASAFSADDVWRKVAMTLHQEAETDSPEGRLYRKAVEALNGRLVLRASLMSMVARHDG